MTTTTDAPMSDSRIPTDTTLTLLPVLDNAAYAWRNLDNPAG